MSWLIGDNGSCDNGLVFYVTRAVQLKSSFLIRIKVSECGFDLKETTDFSEEKACYSVTGLIKKVNRKITISFLPTLASYRRSAAEEKSL